MKSFTGDAKPYHFDAVPAPAYTGHLLGRYFSEPRLNKKTAALCGFGPGSGYKFLKHSF
jgi:hypothetical protein